MIPIESSHNRAIGPGCIGSTMNIPQRDPVFAPKEKKAQVPTSGAKAFVTDPSDLAGDPRTRTQYAPAPPVALYTADCLAEHRSDVALPEQVPIRHWSFCASYQVQ